MGKPREGTSSPAGSRARAVVLMLVPAACSGGTSKPTASVGSTRPSPPIVPEGQIAFTSERDGNAEIYLMNADGTGVERLTNDPSDDAAPAWSADGTMIAFVSGRDGNEEIYVMNATGSGIRRLTDHPADEGDPAWSPASGASA